MDTTNDSNLNNKLSAIDKALAAAKARKAMKTSDESATDSVSTTQKEKPVKETKTKDDSTKTAERAAKDAMREARRLERESERAQRRASRAAEKTSGKPAHMKKVETAGSKLPKLNESAELSFNEITSNFSADQVAALALHLQHFNRVKSTERALGQEIKVGQQVRIIGGEPRFIGKTATVTIARRIRCYVEVPGARKPVYLFTSDVEVLAPAAAKATGTGG